MERETDNRRASGDRRWGLESGFPIRDSNGVMVIRERRINPDRRLDNTTMAERMLMFTGMPPPDDF